MATGISLPDALSMATIKAACKASHKFPGPGDPWAAGDEVNAATYRRVGEALGFTAAEIAALVRCNDSGCTFAEIAELIESHPPIYSSELTPRRRGEAHDFVVRCKELAAAARRRRPAFGFFGHAPSAFGPLYEKQKSIDVSIEPVVWKSAPTVWLSAPTVWLSQLLVPSKATPPALSTAAQLGIWTPPTDAAKLPWQDGVCVHEPLVMNDGMKKIYDVGLFWGIGS